SIRKVGSRGNERSQVQRASLRHTIEVCTNCTEPGSGNIQSFEHLIEQRRLASASCRVEGFLQPVKKEIVRVEIQVGGKFTAQCPDVSDIQRHLRRQIAGHRQREVLNVRRHEIRIESIQKSCSIGHWDGCCSLRKEQRLDRYDALIRYKFLDTEVRIC